MISRRVKALLSTRNAPRCRLRRLPLMTDNLDARRQALLGLERHLRPTN